MNQIPHDEWTGKIIARINGELDAGENALFDSHVETCPHCRRELREYELLSRRLRALERDAVVPELSPDLLALKQEITQHRVFEEAQQVLEQTLLNKTKDNSFEEVLAQESEIAGRERASALSLLQEQTASEGIHPDLELNLNFDYPRVKQSLGIAALHDAFPTLFLNAHGDICGVNPLALWLWGELKEGEPFHPDRLLGKNMLAMAAQQFHRIPVELNREFYTKPTSIAKRQNAHSQMTTYAPFIAAMRSDPVRAEIYESAPAYPAQEWEYTLTIAHPEQPENMLEFQSSIYRMEENSGFLIVYYPVRMALPVIEEINSRLIERLGKVISVQIEKREREESNTMALETGYHTFYRDYYPRLIYDPLWYLCGENKAHRLMMDMSVVGMHFFELFLAPVVKYFLGAIQDSTAPRALKYFDMFTVPYMREGHDLHERYEQTMQRLYRVEGFNDVLERSRRWQICLNPMAGINLKQESDEPFYTSRVILPWRFDPDVHLQFKSMVRFLFDEGMLPQGDRRNYEVTLVPENYETDVAMLLLPLLVSPPSDVSDFDERDRSHSDRLFLWLLALLKVVEEAMGTSDENTVWEPEEPFERIYSGLQSRPAMSRQGQTEVMMLMTEMRVTIELLGRRGKIGKASLLRLLHTFMLTRASLKPLSDFLKRELEMEFEYNST